MRYGSLLIGVICALASGCASNGRVAARYLQRHPAELQAALDNLALWQKAQRSTVDKQNVVHLRREIFDESCGTILGSRSANQQIALFSDHNCHFCEAAIKAIETSPRFIQGDVNIVVRELPVVAKDSRLRALLALKAAAHNRYYASAPPNGSDQILQDFASDRCGDSELDRNIALAKALNITATPVFIVDDDIKRGWGPRSADFRLFWKL